MSLASDAELPRPHRLLLIVAHPGDAAGALASPITGWIAEGTVAELICGTSGDAGGHLGHDDATADPLALAAAAEAAQRASATAAGLAGVTFLHRPDGALVNDLATREQLVRHIRRVRPDSLATFDPRELLRDGQVEHVDHREIGLAALDAIVPAGNAMAFPSLAKSEGLAPHHVSRILLVGSVDGAGRFLELTDG